MSIPSVFRFLGFSLLLLPLPIEIFGANIPGAGELFSFETNDVISLVGGANIAAAQDYGYLDVLLAVAMPDRHIRLRNQGWEGDTAYSQPRDLNFGAWSEQFTKAGTTVIFAQFGQMEALDGPSVLPRFIAAYDRLLDEFSLQTSRIVLISPFPFEKSSPPLPDLSRRNTDVAQYVEAIRHMSRRRGLAFVDLFTSIHGRTNTVGLARSGIQLTGFGQWVVAREIMRQLDPDASAIDRIQYPGETGTLAPQAVDALRQSILIRNRLWFDYWRPMNWAFLSGDRTEQPSSRDYRDPRIRWFPAEMNQFLRLIEIKEREIANQTTALARQHK